METDFGFTTDQEQSLQKTVCRKHSPHHSNAELGLQVIMWMLLCCVAWEIMTRKTLVHCWEHEGPCTHRSPGKLRILTMQDCCCCFFFPRKRWKTCSSIQKAGKWRWLIAWWSVLSVVPGHINLLQPGPEVASNLNDHYITCIAIGPPSSHNQNLRYLII